MFYVYVARSISTGKKCIGQTIDPASRLKRHNKSLSFKKSGYTYKNRGPWVIVYAEMYKSRMEAVTREKQLKTYRGREFIKRVII